MKRNIRQKREYNNVIAAPFGRRLLSYGIDFIILLIIALISFVMTDNIYYNTKGGRSVNTTFYEVKKDSGLYLTRDEGMESLLFEADINEGNNTFIYLNRLEYFYTSPNTHFDYQNTAFYDENAPFDYLTMVMKMGNEDTLFTFTTVDETITYTFKETLTNSQKTEAWTGLYKNALQTFKKSSAYRTAEEPIRHFVLINIMLSAFIGTILPWLIAPFIFGHGRSLGKFLTGLAIVNKKGYFASNGQIVVRFLILSTLETSLNIVLFFIPLMLTSGILTITYNYRALHDLISKTYVVDAQKSKIFKTKEDEAAYMLSSPEDKLKNTKYFTEERKGA